MLPMVYYDIGIGASLAGPVLAGPLFRRFNEFHYKNYMCFARTYYSQTTSKVLLTPLYEYLLILFTLCHLTYIVIE